MINTKIKNFIKNHALESFPNECCGFIYEKDNKIFYKKVKNIANNKTEDFQISLNDYLYLKDHFNILYVYHSHVNDNEDFSEQDKLYSDEIAINYILYHIKTNKFKIYESNSLVHKYVGRFYQYKKYDCFTLVKDFYKNELNINLNYERYISNQINFKDLDVQKEIEDFYKNNNLIKVNSENLEKNDLLLIQTIMGGHLAIYLGDNRILHHPSQGFSRVENYCNFYKRNTVFALRKG